MWLIEPLEIADNNGKGTGRFRLTATSDEDGGGPFGLCEHEHQTTEEAFNCLDAKTKSKSFGVEDV